jgi:(E)-4-hydroxy-3-methylbut-2-enyl-diphosphate synthase
VTLAYAADVFAPRRRLSRVVHVGDVALGGDNPVRVQSMTTTDTLDTAGTADQVERLVDAGCEIVRITAPSLKEAENLAAIRKELTRRGVRVPLVADIHYTPRAAMVAAEHVEKVRINPGNFADKKKFEIREYSDAQYAEEVLRVAERFRPLVRRCRTLGRALRIGTNHGSLADRILNRFGDTPRGMVESALEFLDVCEEEGFRDVVFSMKASNAQVAIQAYRLLAARLLERDGPEAAGPPFHIGVTEAGDGEDGRIKSAIGIGALLEDGIGDTIRVSLTEDPVREVPVAIALARRSEARWALPARTLDPGAPFVDDPFAHRRRATRSIGRGPCALGGTNPVRVEVDLGHVPADPGAAARELCAALARVPELACEGIGVNAFDQPDIERVRAFASALRRADIGLPLVVRAETNMAAALAEDAARLVVPMGVLVDDAQTARVADAAAVRDTAIEWELRGELSQVPGLVDRVLDACAASGLEDLAVCVDTERPVHGARLAAARLRARGAADVPLVLRHRRDASQGDEAALLGAAVDLGAPLCDGIGDVVALEGFESAERALELGYRILQGARLRTSWTEFISCPSCGRTLFDLEETTARIRQRTGHLVGVKIAIMGCIVNGPGEMADADFGYVGSGPGTVNLFVGKECVLRHVPQGEADDRLVEIIRAQGRWTEPQ